MINVEVELSRIVEGSNGYFSKVTVERSYGIDTLCTSDCLNVVLNDYAESLFAVEELEVNSTLSITLIRNE